MKCKDCKNVDYCISKQADKKLLYGCSSGELFTDCMPISYNAWKAKCPFCGRRIKLSIFEKDGRFKSTGACENSDCAIIFESPWKESRDDALMSATYIYKNISKDW